MVRKELAKRLVLFDAHAIVHRAYHALPDFSTKDGEPTGGLYGLSTMLIRAITDLKPDYMAACYDLPGPTFRHKEYKDYKAGRAKADDELKQQLGRSRDIFSAFHIPIYDAPGFEADDMLGTIVEQTKKKKDLEVLIVTGDMDTLQLVKGMRVRVFTLRKGINDTVVYDEKTVNERFGFGPELLPDYKGLRGDPSDNIIGVPGIGEKTGGELIQKFGTLEKLYTLLKKEKGKDELLRSGIKPRVVDLLSENKEEAMFSKMLATIRRDAPISFALPEKTWGESYTPDAVVSLFNQLEFRSLSVRARGLLSKKEENEGDKKHSNKNDTPPASLFDGGEKDVDPVLLRETAIGLWLLDSDKTTPGPEEIFEHTGERDMLVAKRKILAEIKEEGLERLYDAVELPLLPVVRRAQEKGVLIDVAYLKKLSLDYHKKLAKAESAIYEYADEVFNINSPKQLSVVLFDKLLLAAKGLKKTEGGARSTRESELEKLKDLHPIIAEILNYRETQKLLSTYIDTIPTMVDAEGRLHTTLKQDGTTTGRFSSSDPNVQNIPVREGLGAPIREAFISPKGRVLVSFDYSQIEMRVLAMLSEDPGLREIFRSGEDIHTSVAARVFRVAPDAVTKEMRRRAKVINFGIIYGMGVSALRANLGSSREEAQQFYDQYFLAFPKIADYFEKTKSDAKKKGYTETIFGRRRHFPNLRSRIPFMKAMAERMAQNAPIQGTAADFVKIAMVRVEEALHKEKLDKNVDLLLQVHDELIFEVDDDREMLGKFSEVVRETMTSVAKGTKGESVPLVVNMASGKRWGSLK